tara:strand:- start:55 stop:291 length:237 start_codon:yes stop_codon:yes gene_type:complete
LSEFFIAKLIEIIYSRPMYIDEKQLKFEMKEVHSQIHELANDLGGDIRYLHQEISDLRETLDILQQEVRTLKEMINVA